MVKMLEGELVRDAFVIADLLSKPAHKAVHLEDALCEATRVKGCVQATSDMSVFLQISDLLLGAVHHDLRNPDGALESKRGQAKHNVVAFVKERLGLAKWDPLISASAGAKTLN
jgi:hypothetical protein